MNDTLSIKLIRQEPQSNDCLRSCALMVFEYYKDQITHDELYRRLHSYKKHSGLLGSHMQDLGKLALKKGYECQIVHYDWDWWNKDLQNSSESGKKAGTLSSLKKLQKEDNNSARKLVYQKDIDFIERGGIMKMHLPTLTEIDSFLQRNIPVIVLVNAQQFYQNMKVGFDHAILVIGKTNGKYIIRDPLYSIETISSDDLLYSWSNARGWMMVVLPKPSSSPYTQVSLLEI